MTPYEERRQRRTIDFPVFHWSKPIKIHLRWYPLTHSVPLQESFERRVA